MARLVFVTFAPPTIKVFSGESFMRELATLVTRVYNQVKSYFLMIFLPCMGDLWIASLNTLWNEFWLVIVELTSVAWADIFFQETYYTLLLSTNGFL